MEYVSDRGTYDELPLDEILTDFELLYPDLVEAHNSGEVDEAFATGA
jgi:hypothetical protein